jgi:hypothetical protein
MAEPINIKNDYAKDFAISWNQHLKQRQDSKEGNYIIKTNGVVEEKYLTDQEFFKIWFDFIWYNKSDIITTIKVNN